jgi:hypothetical protein
MAPIGGAATRVARACRLGLVSILDILQQGTLAGLDTKPARSGRLFSALPEGLGGGGRAGAAVAAIAVDFADSGISRCCADDAGRAAFSLTDDGLAPEARLLRASAARRICPHRSRPGFLAGAFCDRRVGTQASGRRRGHPVLRRGSRTEIDPVTIDRGACAPVGTRPKTHRCAGTSATVCTSSRFRTHGDLK